MTNENTERLEQIEMDLMKMGWTLMEYKGGPVNLRDLNHLRFSRITKGDGTDDYIIQMAGYDNGNIKVQTDVSGMSRSGKATHKRLGSSNIELAAFKKMGEFFDIVANDPV